LNIKDDSTGGSVTLTTSPDCAWMATSSEAWIRVRPTSGTGSIRIELDIDQNPQSSERRAVLTIGGQRVSVTQAGR
jgi:hypothetical protein